MGKPDHLLSIESKEFLTLADLVNIFEALDILNLILQGTNINHINGYDALSAFVAKLKLGIIELKKKMRFLFIN